MPKATSRTAPFRCSKSKTASCRTYRLFDSEHSVINGAHVAPFFYVNSVGLATMPAEGVAGQPEGIADGITSAADHQRLGTRQHVRVDRPRLHDGLRDPEPDQLCARRRADGRRADRAVDDYVSAADVRRRTG